MGEPVTVQMNTDPKVIDMALGHPSPDLLPLDLMRSAAEQRFAVGDPLIMQYGAEQGDVGFRQELAKLLTQRTNGEIQAESLVVTGGISQALSMLCGLYTNTGDEVLVEDPTYFLSLRIFEDFGLKVTSIPGDDDGLDPDALEHYLQQRDSAIPLRFLYTIPVFQNPTGRTLAEPKREKLIELSEKYGFHIVADEAYQLLSYETLSPAPMACTGPSKVISLGSFSKVLGPGLRLGWIQAAPEHVKKIITSGMLDSGGGLNPFTSSIVRSMCESGDFARHLDHLLLVYRQRMKALFDKIHKILEGAVELTYPGGGYFLWVKVPDELDTRELKKAARRYKVNFIPGSRTSALGSFPHHLRLSISYNDEDRLQAGATRLANVISDTYNRL